MTHKKFLKSLTPKNMARLSKAAQKRLVKAAQTRKGLL